MDEIIQQFMMATEETGNTVYLPTFAKLDPQKRNTIIQVAIRHFAEFGFDGANISEMAKDAGVSTGAMYRYFTSKEDLFEFISLLAHSIIKIGLVELRKSNVDTYEEEVKRLCNLVIDQSLRYPCLAKVYVTKGTALDQGTLPGGNQFFSPGMSDYYSSIIQLGIEEGRLRPNTNLKRKGFFIANLLLLVISYCAIPHQRLRLSYFFGDEFLHLEEPTVLSQFKDIVCSFLLDD